MITILVVDDEPSMRQGLADNLEFEGYNVELASNGKEALEKLKNEIFDLVILDVMMPEVNGFDVCKKLRSDGNEVPVILLTAKGEEIDRVLGLEFGADDYITKPFSLREMMARIKAILRRSQNSHNGTSLNNFQKVGLIEVDFKQFEAKKNNIEIKLSHREFEVLHYLWDHNNEIVTRNDLLKNIWKYDEFPTTRTIDNFVLRLRQKIEINSNDPKILLTVHGIGYKMIRL
jgi:DNA-binding response OmpR family regulator